MEANDGFDALARDYLDRHPGKVRLAGPKHGVFALVEGVVGNTRPNPRRLVALEGLWAISQALDRGMPVEAFLFAPSLARTPQARSLVERAIERADDSYLVSGRAFERVSERDSSDGLLALVPLPRPSLDAFARGERAFVVVLDGLEIPGNVGTVIRSVDGAGGSGIVMVNRRTRLTHPKVFKASQGSLFTVPVIDMELEEAIAWLAREGFRIILADTRAELRYWETDWSGKIALVAGSERYGISREWYSSGAELVSIPMAGTCDSLNVAIATTILAYEGCLRQSGSMTRA